LIKRIYDKRAYSYKIDSRIIQCIREQIAVCDNISNLLSTAALERALDSASEISHEGIDNLLTITSLIEENLCRKSTIAKYY
jgi:hypothetical protein